MTTTDPALCTNAPTTGFNTPVIANKIARKLRLKEKIKLHLWSSSFFLTMKLSVAIL